MYIVIDKSKISFPLKQLFNLFQILGFFAKIHLFLEILSFLLLVSLPNLCLGIKESLLTLTTHLQSQGEFLLQSGYLLLGYFDDVS